MCDYHDSYCYIKIRNFISCVEQDILSFALLTREMSCSTLEKKFIFPSIHVLFSMKRFFVFPYRVKETRVSRTRSRSGKIRRVQIGPLVQDLKKMFTR